MTFQVLREFEVEMPTGTITLKEKQRIKLSKDEAVPLIQDGLIQPVERVAYKVYSEILQAYLWIVDTDQDMHSLRSQGITEAIYSADEIKKLEGMERDSLKAIHQIKEVFPESSIEEANRHADR